MKAWRQWGTEIRLGVLSMGRLRRGFGTRQVGGILRGLAMAIAAFSWCFFLVLGSPAWAAGFVLCPESAGPCAQTDYFVGVDRSGRVAVGGAVAEWPRRGFALYPQVADGEALAAALEPDEVRLEMEGGEAIALQQVEALRVGALEKRQVLKMPVLSPEAGSVGKVETTTDLVWGDTLRISSKRLAIGDPVALRIERSVENVGNPETEGATARVQLQTWVNGHVMPKLDYQLAKFAGAGEKNREQGKRKTSVSVLVKVGEAVRLESRLRMQDGVVASGAPQVFEGSHGVRYGLDLLSDDSCARSESGLLTVGDCD